MLFRSTQRSTNGAVCLSSLLFSSLLFLNSCSKDVPIAPPEDKVEALTPAQLEMKAKLNDAAMILAHIVNVPEIHKELSQLSYLNHEFNKLPFKNLIDSETQKTNGKVFKFSHFRKEFINRLNTSKSSDGYDDLLKYLVENNCYLYVPYSLDWYPEERRSFTVAAHPIDNNYEGIGYRSICNGKSIDNEQVVVDEAYTEDYPVLIIMPYPPDELNLDEVDDGNLGIDGNSTSPGTLNYEVKVYEVWCQNYCGGIFEGDIEMNIVRGYPTDASNGTWSSRFQFEYPKDLVKAAKEGKEKAWKIINTVWDSNWKVEKDQEVIAMFDYDWDAGEIKVTGTVKWKSVTGSVTFELPGKKYRASPLLVETEMDRGHFFSSQASPGPTDEVRNGMIVRQFGDVKVTTHIETRYN